jgi:outer membrane protein assembly factor BamB
VETLDPNRPAMVLVVEDDLKGKAPFRKVPVNLQGDAEAAKGKQVPLLLKRLGLKLPLLLFVKQRDKEFMAFAYTNGTWFQITGTQTEDGVRCAFTHCEPYLRRTFKGTTAELRQTILDGLSGKKEPPAPNGKEKPGLGPELMGNGEWGMGNKEPSSLFPIPHSPLPIGAPIPIVFGVIPTVLIGGPVALLAMLFPALFGGLMLLLRRWMVALSVLSLNSTLYLLQSWFGSSLLQSWWGTPLALWLGMTMVTLLGVLWAWRRQVRGAVYAAAFQPPGRREVFTLALSSGVALAILAYWLPHSLERLDLWGKTLVMFAAGLCAATLHALYLRFVVSRQSQPKPALPGEGVMLWTMMLASTGLIATFTNETPATEQGGENDPYRVVWRFQPPPPCWIASSPRVEGERVYIGVVHGSLFRTGAVYCLDRAKGQVVWSFNNSGKMKDSFSSPCLAEGRVYIGEGFHQDQDCKLYCLDAATGQKLWEFQTTSHTESTPCVANGRVFFGAGDDGLYCLDATTGKERWHLKELHVDASPLVQGDRVFAGSGKGDRYQETALFCLDVNTGKAVWRIPMDLPVWGMPALGDDHLFVGLGNGSFHESDEKPAGAVLCLEATTGKRLWRYEVPDGVLNRVTVDARNVYFGSRDGHCWAVDRNEGKLVWKQDLGSPLVTAPVLAERETGSRLYAVSSAGRAVRLDADSGNIVWEFDVKKETNQDATMFSSPAIATEGKRCQIWFGSGLNTFSRGILYCIEDR